MAHGLCVNVYLQGAQVTCEYETDQTLFDNAWFYRHELEVVSGQSIISEQSVRSFHQLAPLHSQGHEFQETFHRIAIPPNSIRHFVVRYSTLWHAIGFTGKNLSHKKVEKDDWIERYDTLSKPLDFDGEYDFFLSYRWMTGRWRLLLTVLVQFNHIPAVLCSFGITVLIMFIASLVHEYGHVRLLPYLDENDKGYQELLNLEGQGLYDPLPWDGAWYFSSWFILILMCLGLLGAGQLISRQKIFFDKVCISQTHSELNRAALLSLPFILSRCKDLVCIVDAGTSGYFQRLWCLFRERICC